MIVSTIIGKSNETYYNIANSINDAKRKLENEFSNNVNQGILDGFLPWRRKKREANM